MATPSSEPPTFERVRGGWQSGRYRIHLGDGSMAWVRWPWRGPDRRPDARQLSGIASHLYDVDTSRVLVPDAATSGVATNWCKSKPVSESISKGARERTKAKALSVLACTSCQLGKQDELSRSVGRKQGHRTPQSCAGLRISIFETSSALIRTPGLGAP